ASYAEWAQTLVIRDLCSLVFAESGTADAERAIQMVVESLKPFRGVEHPATPLTLRLPLGSAGGAAVCFWVDLVRRAAHWKATIPSFFWSHDGQSGCLLLHLGKPPRRTLAQLWLPIADHEEFCDLVPPIARDRTESLPPLAAGVSTLLARPDATVH